MKLLVILSLVFLGTSAFAKGKDCDNYEKYGNVSKEEMTKIVTAKNATIIDVNSTKSFKKSRIPGAVHFASNKKTFDKVLPKDKNAPIVAYCGGEMCTAWQRAAEKACEMGYTNIRHFSAGITGWNKMNTKTKKKM